MVLQRDFSSLRAKICSSWPQPHENHSSRRFKLVTRGQTTGAWVPSQSSDFCPRIAGQVQINFLANAPPVFGVPQVIKCDRRANASFRVLFGLSAMPLQHKAGRLDKLTLTHHWIDPGNRHGVARSFAHDYCSLAIPSVQLRVACKQPQPARGRHEPITFQGFDNCTDFSSSFCHNPSFSSLIGVPALRHGLQYFSRQRESMMHLIASPRAFNNYPIEPVRNDGCRKRLPALSGKSSKIVITEHEPAVPLHRVRRCGVDAEAVR